MEIEETGRRGLERPRDAGTVDDQTGVRHCGVGVSSGQRGRAGRTWPIAPGGIGAGRERDERDLFPLSTTPITNTHIPCVPVRLWGYLGMANAVRPHDDCVSLPTPQNDGQGAMVVPV